MDSNWNLGLKLQLEKELGAKQAAELLPKYTDAFPTNYREECAFELAGDDVKQIEKLSASRSVDINFYVEDNMLHLRIFKQGPQIPLSDILPMLENLDLRTIAERPYKISLPTETVWISDFAVVYGRTASIDFETIETIFQATFLNTLLGFSENDGFNKLVIGAQLSWREITILRAYAKYLRQAGFRFSQPYIEMALANNPTIAKNLVQYFLNKFDPETKTRSLDIIEKQVLQNLEQVSSLDEDRILRRLLLLMQATLRTNYFQTKKDGHNKEYLSVKLNSKDIPELPQPQPMFEIFVYAPRFEGIHLRNAKVARGGIRWSDRPEDFRTEILGLMKAQKVKNAVIVPSGAKGGFVLKTLPTNAPREVIQQEVVTCYQFFISGLLDLTDNIVDRKVIHPQQTVIYDEDDTYLVVAADKGTASFSDIANRLSKDYHFWLGDAFASGGSVGYDHKKMGITARGAWESIKRHFHELNIDVMTTDFTVVGIGDMSGDVFGNGMIYSPHTKLLAAFDHRHIFLDPNPNSHSAFDERERMFNLPTSSWADYNPALISTGGGVFKRSEKSIKLSPEIKAVLGITEEILAPNDLIRAILKAPVDLLWNGGIGTYVKASTESHTDVGDRTNEYCRVNGDELRCRVVGEGGNLGLTQLGRVEYALQGGLINTDFIDNSAGVDCSDHEVNIKILLNQEVNKRKLTEPKRNEILASMTKEVGDLVLKDNYNQALIMSIASFYTSQMIGLQIKYIQDLEAQGIIKRSVEFLPDDKKLFERKTAGLGLTRPELAVLLAYTKIHLKYEILQSDIPEDPYFIDMLDSAFPQSLCTNYQSEIEKHPLQRDIVATQLSNLVVNDVGTLFVYNLHVETGATVAEILRACVASLRIFEASELQKIILSFNFTLPITTQYELIGHIRRLVYLSTRWFIRHRKLNKDNTPGIIAHFSECVKKLESSIPNLMGGFTKTYSDSLSEQFSSANISKDIAYKIAATRAMYTALNIIEIETKYHFELDKIAEIYFAVGEIFNLLWFRDRLASDSREGYWETLSRLTLRDELDSIQRYLTIAVMKMNSKEQDADKCIDKWREEHRDSLRRWEKILEMVHSSTTIDYVMFFIALRELTDIIQSSEALA